jgi:hypothetical protein
MGHANNSLNSGFHFVHAVDVPNSTQSCNCAYTLKPNALNSHLRETRISDYKIFEIQWDRLAARRQIDGGGGDTLNRIFRRRRKIFFRGGVPRQAWSINMKRPHCVMQITTRKVNSEQDHLLAIAMTRKRSVNNSYIVGRRHSRL